MTNFPELRPGERSAEAERVAVLRSASPVRLAALAMFVAAIFMAVMLLGAPGRSEGPPAFLSKALGAADSEAPLVRHPEAGVEVAIQDSSFRIRSSSATVTLATQGAGPGDWHRFEHGVSRPIAEGAETHPRRRADTGAVSDDPRATGRPDLALAHRHGSGPARRR